MPIDSQDSNLSSKTNIVVALDYAERKPCLDLVNQLDPKLCRLKVGKEMFTLFGPPLVEELQHLGFDIFLDLKFHDIPNTVAKAVAAAASLGVWMVNVHASGGERMMSAAKAALTTFDRPPLLIAVTVLTSMEAEDLSVVGINAQPSEQVTRLARLAARCELDGVVCSALEARDIKVACGESFVTVTPGIRPLGVDSGDQRRVMTPERALAAGADFLVIGRAITQADNPLSTLEEINTSLVSIAKV